jgi:HTH-type transcriptional regulator / antitoxin HigA
MNKLQLAELELLSPPGDTIQETIDYLCITQAELAERMGITPGKVNDIIKAKEPITIATALKLEFVLGIDAQFWINRQNSYNEKKFRISQYELLDKQLAWVKNIPVSLLQKLGYLSKIKGSQLVEAVLQFFSVASPAEWQQVYVQKYANTHYKKSTTHNTTLGSMATWLRIGELEAEKRNIVAYNKEQFKQVVQNLVQLVPTKGTAYLPQIVQQCASAGVAVVYTPKIPKSPVSGAMRWHRGKPIIQLTDRHCTNDQFWFSFFHEAGHVILHGKTDIFLEDFEGAHYDAKKENEANHFAAKMLLKENINIILQGDYSEINIKRIAKQYNTHPAIIVGRLQREEVIGYNRMNGLKDKVKLF